jgi:hypothetical protein
MLIISIDPKKIHIQIVQIPFPAEGFFVHSVAEGNGQKKCGIDEIPPDTYEYEIPLHVRSGTTEEYHQL